MFSDEINIWQIGIVNCHKWEELLGDPSFLFEQIFSRDLTRFAG